MDTIDLGLAALVSDFPAAAAVLGAIVLGAVVVGVTRNEFGETPAEEKARLRLLAEEKALRRALKAGAQMRREESMPLPTPMCAPSPTPVRPANVVDKTAMYKTVTLMDLRNVLPLSMCITGNDVWIKGEPGHDDPVTHAIVDTVIGKIPGIATKQLHLCAHHRRRRPPEEPEE